MRDVERWLDRLGLGKYSSAFAESELDFEVLPDLSEEDLEKLRILLGPRRKLLKAIAALGNEESQLICDDAIKSTSQPRPRPPPGEAERRRSPTQEPSRGRGNGQPLS